MPHNFLNFTLSFQLQSMFGAQLAGKYGELKEPFHDEMNPPHSRSERKQTLRNEISYGGPEPKQTAVDRRSAKLTLKGEERFTFINNTTRQLLNKKQNF